MLCPRCGYGTLYAARIRASGVTVNLCDECDAMWLVGEEIRPDTFHDLTTHLQDNGIELSKEALEIMYQD